MNANADALFGNSVDSKDVELDENVDFDGTRRRKEQRSNGSVVGGKDCYIEHLLERAVLNVNGYRDGDADSLSDVGSKTWMRNRSRKEVEVIIGDNEGIIVGDDMAKVTRNFAETQIA